MSLLNTVTAEIESAANQLEAIGSGISTQSAAAAAPTSMVAPAGADPVSALQSALFSAYGSQYQQISAQAQAIHQQFVQTLGQSGTSYSTAEATNAASAATDAATDSNPLWDLLNSNTAGIGYTGAGNWSAGLSDLLGMAGGGLLDVPADAAVGDLAGLDTALAADTAPVGVGGLGGAPVLAGVAQSSSVGGLSVPPNWAGAGVSAEPVKLVSANWAGPAPQTAPVSTVPAGMPAVASSAGRSGGLGAPRYGHKPTVMPKLPKPAIV